MTASLACTPATLILRRRRGLHRCADIGYLGARWGAASPDARILKTAHLEKAEHYSRTTAAARSSSDVSLSCVLSRSPQAWPGLLPLLRSSWPSTRFRCHRGVGVGLILFALSGQRPLSARQPDAHPRRHQPASVLPVITYRGKRRAASDKEQSMLACGCCPDPAGHDGRPGLTGVYVAAGGSDARRSSHRCGPRVHPFA